VENKLEIKKYLFQSEKAYQESKSTYPYRERLIRNQKVLVLIGKSLLRIKKYLSSYTYTYRERPIKNEKVIVF